MKYENTQKKYLFTKGLFKGRIVKTYNAELDKDRPDISWSHGLTHFRDADTGEYVGWCGICRFEEIASELDEKNSN